MTNPNKQPKQNRMIQTAKNILKNYPIAEHVNNEELNHTLEHLEHEFKELTCRFCWAPIFWMDGAIKCLHCGARDPKTDSLLASVILYKRV